MQGLNELNRQFGVIDHLLFKEVGEGITITEINSRHGSATLALQGAQLLSWKPTGEKAVIWVSDAARYVVGKVVRGGVPVCWPWFGPHVKEASFPAHGYVRTSPWQIVKTEMADDGRCMLVLRLEDCAENRRFWPYSSVLELSVSIGDTLEISLLTRNTGSHTFAITEALHTYFAVSDVRQVKVHGLDECAYLDKVDGGDRKQQTGAVEFAAETDRVYVDAPGDCIIEDSGWRRRIRISKQGSDSTVVWNPWIEKATRMGDLGKDGYLRMLCVESANVAENALTIAPGSEHSMSVSYRLEKYTDPHV